MARRAGERYECKLCGAALVYEKPCPCDEGTGHREVCCDQQMTPVSAAEPD